MSDHQTYEWHQARLGKFTASEIHKLMGIKGLGDTGLTYIMEKVSEELTGTFEYFENSATRWGVEHEPEARNYFELEKECEVEKIDTLIPEWSDQVGASPDGKILGEKKGIEIKCPEKSTNHIKNLIIKTQDDFKNFRKEYYWQVQMGLMITEFESWYFISYDPRFTGNLRMFQIEIYPDKADLIILKNRIEEAITIKKSILEILKTQK
jgi:putative phage-type endonuclease